MSLWFKGYVDALRSSDWTYRRRTNSIPVRSSKRLWAEATQYLGLLGLLKKYTAARGSLEVSPRVHGSETFRHYERHTNQKWVGPRYNAWRRDTSVAAASSGFLTVIRALYDASFLPNIARIMTERSISFVDYCGSDSLQLCDNTQPP